MKYYLGVDIGGTNVVVGAVDKNGCLIDKSSFKTNIPRPANDLCKEITEHCIKVAERNGGMSEVVSIGVGVPGIISEGVIKNASNLKYKDIPLSQILSNMTGKPVFVQNDANAAAYGEYVAGNGFKASSVVVITIGTGIGGGIIINGQIVDGFNGAGAEIGHIIINSGGRHCACGRRGCFETYCSATALINQTKKAMIDDPNSLLWKICPDINDVDGKTAFDAMRLGDVAAKRVVDDFIYYLSIGVENIVTLLQPEVLCIGGGVSNEDEALMIPLRKRLAELSLLGTNISSTRVVAAKLKNDAGVIGAALLGRNE